MSDYKRFISYIYGYDQGEKRENTGFVKVNARGGECRIWVHVKGFYGQRQKPYRVYIFRQKREKLEGQYLGELESRNGALEWNGVTQTDSLMGGFGLEESRGIYIEGETRVFAAEWDDYPVDVDRFQSLERSARQEGPREIREVRREQRQPENIQDTESSGKSSREEEKSDETKKENVLTADSESSQIVQMAADSEPEDPRKRQWEYLVSRFPAVRYQDASGVLLTGIRLGNRELSRIPRDKWGLGNNSFLLHGFYQHHHLLLLRKTTEEQVNYYIGVPGIYNEKEQMLASMFGFEEFRVLKAPDKGPSAGCENFGYWCRLLKQQT